MRGIGKGVKEFKEGINEEPADKGEKTENKSDEKNKFSRKVNSFAVMPMCAVCFY